MNVLVTGGAGYIGSHLVDRFLKRGDRVFIIDNLSTGNIRNIQHNLTNSNCVFVNDTILNEALVDRIVSQVDMIYHLAATVGVKHVVEDPLKGVITNVQGSEIVMKTAFKYWKRILIASTSEVYGKTTKFPFSEEDDRVLGSTSVHRWSYSTAKAIDEHIAFAYNDKGLPISIVRYFNSYGPRIDERGYGSVVAQFIRQAISNQPLSVHGDGTQSRCFTFIRDTVDGTIRAGENKNAIGQCFNIGITTETTINELAHKVIELTDSKSELINISYEKVFGQGFEDTNRRVPSMRKAKEYLGWQPQVSLTEGLNETIEWCRKNYEGRASGGDGFGLS